MDAGSIYHYFHHFIQPICSLGWNCRGFEVSYPSLYHFSRIRCKLFNSRLYPLSNRPLYYWNDLNRHHYVTNAKEPIRAVRFIRSLIYVQYSKGSLSFWTNFIPFPKLCARSSIHRSIFLLWGRFTYSRADLNIWTPISAVFIFLFTPMFVTEIVPKFSLRPCSQTPWRPANQSLIFHLPANLRIFIKYLCPDYNLMIYWLF